MRTFQINFQIQVHESYVGTYQINILIILTIFDELTKRILWINAGGYRGCGRPKSRWIDGVEEDTRKLGCRNWGWMPRIEDAGDIFLRRSRPIQGCTADDDDDDNL
jgi:hypothetical protein